MEWESEAEQLIARAPVFVRPLARRRVEEFARDRGASKVTKVLAEQAYAQMGGRRDRTLRPTAELIGQLEAAAEGLEKDPRFRRRHFQVRPCAGAVGCPRSLIDVEKLAEALAEAIRQSGFPEFLERGMGDRPILSHHRFKAAASGCPNACSQPQISDFGVIGGSAIQTAVDLCTGCLACVRACREGAIVVEDCRPAISTARCIECGDCARACASGALALGERRYRLLVGGALGRHPRLATEAAAVSEVREVAALLRDVLRVLMERGRPGERLAALLSREGTDVLGETRARSNSAADDTEADDGR